MNNFSFNLQNDGLAFLTLSRQPVNALSKEFIASLSEQIDEISKDSKIKILIISSSIKHFCAGADLKERAVLSIDEAQVAVSGISNCLSKLEKLPFPTISAINGSALGGGLELSLCCDFRVAEDSAILGLPETSLGIIPGAGGTQRLPRLIGLSKAKYWIYSARKLSAEEAFIDGVVDFLSPDGEVLETAIDLATELMENAPLALRAAKMAVSKGYDLSIEEGVEVEKEAYDITLNSEDRLEALKAFSQKRSPKWSGR
ncbi:MAG: enoyl-CoA hydratase/isomerase family protein [Candidatus Marinimicrobia bacterium]|nr:enoyl-CoA hydratase/isomerase family protein [Candidatus Neomarinimicrobiota bacterium]